jgi:cyclopropane fatty-acyl-phospholipid synthase-like methyltransferase
MILPKTSCFGKEMAGNTMREYDQIFEWYVSARQPHIGVPEVAEFARSLSPESRILDLGCGDGIPISQFLVQSGFELFGVDSSPKMVERFRANFPNTPAQCARIQDSDFFNISFDAVLAWGVFFHLTEADQEIAISKVAKSLSVGGKFLFTSGKDYGTSDGTMNGVKFRYISLGSANYRKLLHDNGMNLSDERIDQWENYIYIAEKVG